ncbi:hypothetical protein FCL40_01825 [Ferrimonas sediminicola]|uniref:Uncharacterized protein n=1 Tax=Ferrimonas sediminicola TaxID=2569538 RepID=A0A4U1BIN4_9GAMM|nr:hypothetical protein [Ferrimonas sediminicola]TKB51320.1 hypothetical protein FCL40_01825 [Ferrimonas sediminicola]
MSALLLLVSALASEPALAGVEQGEEYICKNGAQERRIQVIYPQGAPLPCEVHYTKGGNSKVLWRAQNEAGYCEAQARAFAAKQETMFFPCEKSQ